MTRKPYSTSSKAQVTSPSPTLSASQSTVASLGVRARLVLPNTNREHQIKTLVASCERLRLEWEGLFQRIIDFLETEAAFTRDDSSSSREISE
jgi:hypothetical protein